MEKMVANRLLWELEALCALSASQFGFRRFCSTSDPLHLLEQNIHQAFKEKRVLLWVFLDLVKAYDSIWREGVLRKLFNLGSRGFLPLFIQNLLSNRTFQVRIGSTLSRHYELQEDVPQGSVLSVLCFALAFNDVVMEVPGGISCSLYVDDFAIYVSGARLAGVERRLQKAIDRIVKWTDSHGFKFTASKTKIVLLHNKRKMIGVPSLNLYSEFIPSTDNVRFLGLVFNRRLRWANYL